MTTSYKFSNESIRLVIINMIIQHLNRVTGRKFKPRSKGTSELIDYWLSIGYEYGDFIKVIDFKVGEWLHIPRMIKYLKPTELFAKDHFKQYLEAADRFSNVELRE